MAKKNKLEQRIERISTAREAISKGKPNYMILAELIQLYNLQSVQAKKVLEEAKQEITFELAGNKLPKLAVRYQSLEKLYYNVTLKIEKDDNESEFESLEVDDSGFSKKPFKTDSSKLYTVLLNIHKEMVSLINQMAEESKIVGNGEIDLDNERMNNDDAILDFAESQLRKEIEKGNPTLLKFILTTKGKERGYGEKIELDSNRTTKVIVQLGNDTEETQDE